MTAPQSLSAERREEVDQLWLLYRNYADSGTSVRRGAGSERGFWSFIAALDAQHAERARASAKKVREAAILQIQAEAAATEDGETLESLNRVIDRLRALSIEGTEQ